MKTAVRTLLTLALAACIVSPLAAAEDQAKKKENRRAAKKRTVQAVRVPRTVQLTDEQKTEVAAINKEYGPKLQELRAKLDGLLSDEQKQARRQVTRANREAKLKRKAAKQAIDEALKLTDEQKKQMAEVQAQVSTLRKEAREKFVALLTPQQKEQMRSARKARKAKPAKTTET